MLMYDFFSGLGGASQAMVDHGWDVITLDNNPRFNPTILADITQWHYTDPRQADLFWFSPVCTEFARFSMPCWFPPETLAPPNMAHLEASLRIIQEGQPRYWIIENVKGAISFFKPYVGSPKMAIGPYFFWGSFPILGQVDKFKFIQKTKHLSSTKKAERAKIPYPISKALCMAVEQTIELPFSHYFAFPKGKYTARDTGTRDTGTRDTGTRDT